MTLLRDQGSGGEPVVFGQSSSARDQSGVATSSVDFLTTATISYDLELEVRLIIFIDGFTFVINNLLFHQQEDGLAVRADWVGKGNQGYIASSRNIVRTFMVIRQVGWR